MELEILIEVRRGEARIARERASTATAVEDALFRSVLAGRIPNDGASPPVSIEPQLANGNGGEVEALELRVASGPGERYDARGVFASQARVLLRALLASKQLEADDKVDWHVLAREPAREPARFGVRTSRAPYPLREAMLGDEVAPGALSVEIDADVLREIRDGAVLSGPVERASLLVGSLLYDPRRAAAVLRVTRSVELQAGSRGASQSHFSLEPASFVAAQRAIKGFGEDEIPAGWSHNHPTCEQCPANPECQVDTLFFSADDVEVHASAFASPYMIGLVAGKLRDRPADRPGFRLYGWERGRVAERSFTVTGSDNERWRAAIPAPREERA